MFVSSAAELCHRGQQNRETPLRQIENSRFEIRCIDGLSNPYLVLAAIIGAGVQGVIDKQPLKMKPCLVDPSTLPAKVREDLGIRQKFPGSLGEALDCLMADKGLEGILGQAAVGNYVTVKKEESAMLEDMDPEKRRHWLIERY